jgi:hypothetical protein
MNVRMKDRLSGIGSAIDADVVAVGPELRVDCSLAAFQKAPYRCNLVRRAVENRRHRPSRHDQRVARRDGIPVAQSGSEIVARDPVGLVEKGTFHLVIVIDVPTLPHPQQLSRCGDECLLRASKTGIDFGKVLGSLD